MFLTLKLDFTLKTDVFFSLFGKFACTDFCKVRFAILPRFYWVRRCGMPHTVLSSSGRTELTTSPGQQQLEPWTNSGHQPLDGIK